MRKDWIFSFHLFHLMLLLPFVLLLAHDEEGFCSLHTDGEDCQSLPLYWKVTNPTLSPSHLQDLPGFTRSVYKRDHALITPESHVFSPLPDWTNTLAAYLITPVMGSHFAMFLAKMEETSKSALPPKDVERFLFVVQGSAILSNGSGTSHRLLVDSYAYLPPYFDHSLECHSAATLVVMERRYLNLESHMPEPIVGSTNMQPLLETPGEVFELRKLLPTSASYDFNIHIMDFQPGEFLNVKEVHYNQHGLLLLEGQGIYRLGDSWYPVQAGDAIWMAPFVPQWYAALGKTPSRSENSEIHNFLKDIGRAEYQSVTDQEALEAFKRLSRLEGIIPALETSHALAYLEKLSPTLPDGMKVVVNCSGRGDEDVQTAIKYLDV